jgi:hypothetical protein
LFVAGVNDPDGVRAVVNRIENVIELKSGQAEDRVDASATSESTRISAPVPSICLSIDVPFIQLAPHRT